MSKGVYIICLDDVLVNTSKLMYDKIRENWRIFSQYFADLGELNYEEIQKRSIYNMSEWLIQKKYIELTWEQYSGLQLIINKLLLDLCNNKIVDEYKPNNLAENSLMKPLFINDQFIDKVYIYFRYYSMEEKRAKERFILNTFINKKINIISLNGDESLSKYLQDNCIDFNALIFNEIKDLHDIVENNQELTNKEFIRPDYGYNKIPQELQYLIDIRENVVSDLNQFIKK